MRVLKVFLNRRDGFVVSFQDMIGLDGIITPCDPSGLEIPVGNGEFIPKVNIYEINAIFDITGNARRN